ncbi:zincin-like metallopeptidase domain-containing protein [Pseudovibrio sp. Tun.PSC04-5.I4]|uniref:zincin-like metallopeptidase domain-containing protein n=1 Tax=Pseudovibrio sp. Tun.PSC04-5.I4 TaxID=1798213 RepID=UPI0008863E8C|nr:zincin-like metallopeptidase domain-containing protein [Pseudovibrio sp. Tun.PSC04-5.I4]SDR48998.1 Antirestriction protein ArdC [Pseudovibrio sp. Tun.PSC04-5.I4]
MTASSQIREFRESVTNEILTRLGQGLAPWHSEQTPTPERELPYSPGEGERYRGINALWLDMQGRQDPRWLTLKEIANAGLSVREGEKGVLVEHWQFTGVEAGQAVKLERPVVSYPSVFNGEQIEGLAAFEQKPRSLDPVERASRLLAQSGVTVGESASDKAVYMAGEDQLELPAQSAFKNAKDYHSTVLHGLTQATAHETRLARETNPFGAQQHAHEAFRAEIASYLVCREVGLSPDPSSHSAYAQRWMEMISEDRNVLFRAARDGEVMRTWVMEPEKRLDLERTAHLRAQLACKDQIMEPVNDKTQHLLNSLDRSANRDDNTDKSLSLQPPKPGRTYLVVPFEDKDQAKVLGARFDRKTSCWYAPNEAALEKLAHWKVNEAPKSLGRADIEKEFTAFLTVSGAELGKKSLVMDGKWHRCYLIGEKESNASYCVHTDGVPTGLLKNFKGELEKWVGTGQKVSKEELAALSAQGQLKAAERALERTKEQGRAAKRAYGIWVNCKTWANQSNCDYLKNKGSRGYGVKLDGEGRMIVPLRDESGRLQSLQFVGTDKKAYLTDGRKEGLFHTIDPQGYLRDGSKLKATDTLVIAEGYSTGSTAHVITNKPTIVAFDADNLVRVAKVIREKYPHVTILIAADNDHHLPQKQKPLPNKGLVKAEEAAKATGGFVITPHFDKVEQQKGLTDWNDMEASRGIDATAREFISEAKQVMPRKEQRLVQTPAQTQAAVQAQIQTQDKSGNKSQIQSLPLAKEQRRDQVLEQAQTKEQEKEIVTERAQAKPRSQAQGQEQGMAM